MDGFTFYFLYFSVDNKMGHYSNDEAPKDPCLHDIFSCFAYNTHLKWFHAFQKQTVYLFVFICEWKYKIRASLLHLKSYSTPFFKNWRI
jgi:hypothetical protein